MELAELDKLKPKTRADCHRVRLQLVEHLPEGDPYRTHRPCPFVSCAYHLHADCDAAGVLTVLSTEQTPLDIAHTCVLDVIDETGGEGVSREEIATVLRTSEERTRFYERKLERKLRSINALSEWRGHECLHNPDMTLGAPG